MRIFLRIVGIIVAVLSLLLLIAEPIAGIIFLIFGALLILLSVKLPQKTAQENRTETTDEKIIKKTKHSVGDTNFSITMKSSKRVVEIPDNTYQDWEKHYKTNPDTIFIEYSDVEGNKSSRYIKPLEIYNKGKVVYIHAFCFMFEEERTFRADRITRLNEKPGTEVADIEGFFKNQLKKPSSPSAEDLAAQAIE